MWNVDFVAKERVGSSSFSTPPLAPRVALRAHARVLPRARRSGGRNVGLAARLRVPQRCKRGHGWCPATSARLRPTFDVEGARTTPLRALKDDRGGVERGTK